MGKIRVMIAEPQTAPLLADLIGGLVCRQDDMRLVGQVSGNIELLVALRRKKKRRLNLRVRGCRADVVVVISPYGDAAHGISSHLLSEYPDLLILVVHPTGRGATAHRRPIASSRVRVAHAANLLHAIRQIDEGPGPTAGAP